MPLMMQYSVQHAVVLCCAACGCMQVDAFKAKLAAEAELAAAAATAEGLTRQAAVAAAKAPADDSEAQGEGSRAPAHLWTA